MGRKLVDMQEMSLIRKSIIIAALCFAIAALAMAMPLQNEAAYAGEVLQATTQAADEQPAQSATSVGLQSTSTTGKTTAKKPSVQYKTHVQNIGWQKYFKNGKAAGTTGRSLRLEAIRINLSSKPVSGGISYRTHIQNIGWESSWKSNGAISGTSGRSLRLEAIQIKLTGNMAKKYDVYYRVHAQNFGWMGWAKNGQKAGTAGYSYRLEAIQVKLVAKGSGAPGSTARPFMQAPLARVGAYEWTYGDVDSWGGNKPINGGGTLSFIVLKKSGRSVTFRMNHIHLYGTLGSYIADSNRQTIKLDANNAATFSYSTYMGDWGTGKIQFTSKNKLRMKLNTIGLGKERMPITTGGQYRTLTWSRNLTDIDKSY